ncbi:unnamed protein product [Amoebophrya sp. A25]|nr:unnamed protein product [Amoebophrya sp. A25]|eukprot:GSA25T00009025001.1
MCPPGKFQPGLLAAAGCVSAWASPFVFRVSRSGCVCLASPKWPPRKSMATGASRIIWGVFCGNLWRNSCQEFGDLEFFVVGVLALSSHSLLRSLLMCPSPPLRSLFSRKRSARATRSVAPVLFSASLIRGAQASSRCRLQRDKG